jgi:hypothetical protein
VGLDFNEHVMEALAEHGGGGYHFLSDTEQLASIFATELRDAGETVAITPTLELVPAPGARIEEVYGYLAEPRGAATAVRLPDFTSGQRRRVVVRMTVSAAALGPRDVAKVALRWLDATRDRTASSTSASVAAEVYVPGAPDLPEYVTDRTVTPATSNPLGVKGVGEAGTIASTPAVVNAVLDAIRHLGVTDLDMPCSPERVWRALQDGSASRDQIAAQGSQGGQHP